MLTSLRRSYTQLITSGSQLVLLIALIEIQSRDVWLWGLSLIAIISLFAWYSSLHRLRLLRSTPTSRISSSAQGYVELIAHGAGTPIYSKYSHLPCLWCRFKVEYRDRENKWQVQEIGETDHPFSIDDGSGKCTVNPSNAEIITHHKESWHIADYRYTEWKLLHADTLYVLGEFKTMGGGSSLITHKELVNQVITEWKGDSADLLKRFDLDKNNLLDIDEWMLARQAAKREAHKRLDAARAEPDTHSMQKPHDGRLFLISNLAPEQLTVRFARWTWLHLAIFFGALGGVAWLLNTSY